MNVSELLAQAPLVLLGLGVAILAVLLTIWWSQRTFRWPIVLVLCLALAPALSWASGKVFQVADYRAGCDGLCLGFRGGPLAFFAGETEGTRFEPGMFALNSLIYLAILLGWGGVVYTLAGQTWAARRSGGWRFLLSVALLMAPLALAPLYLPPPEAHVRGDNQRIAINARREVFMYDNAAPAPILRVGLQDVRPQPDGSPGMRVCLTTYTFFYVPIGQMYLDMTPEGVHSTRGGILARDASCWNQ